MSESESPKKEELIIQQKVYDMIMYAYPAIEQFPKAQKFSLAQDMKRCLDNIMRYIIAANKKYTKKTTLQELDIEVAALKVYIRMAHELGYLPPKKYEVWSKMTVEVGKMVGGWIKATREKTLTQDAAEVPVKAEGPEETYQCSECSDTITKKIKDFSEQRYGQALCYKCQRKRKKGNRLQLPFLGGSHWDGSGAGVFALNINEPRSNVNSGIGFRSALPSSQMPGPCGVRVSAGG